MKGKSARVIACAIFGSFALLVYLANYFSIDDVIVSYGRNLGVKHFEMDSEDLPLILEATKFHSTHLFSSMESIRVPLFPDDCPVRCRLSTNISDYDEADVALFHLRNIDLKLMKVPIVKENRLNVLYTYEAPVNDQLNAAIPKDFFNLTLTYSGFSDVTDWNDAFDPIEAGDDSKMVWHDSDIDAVVANKTQLAVMISSNCHTMSNREALVKQIRTLANITLLGKCYSDQLCDSDCYNGNIAKSFFYLSFENSVCPDYVTEKFWHVKNLTVPVVLKRSVLSSLAQNEYFLAVDDFPSAEALVDKLVWYSKNLNEYKKFFGWTKKYRKPYKKWTTLCDLCKLAHKQERHRVPDVHVWWNNFKNRCEAPSFASRVFTNSKKV